MARRPDDHAHTDATTPDDDDGGDALLEAPPSGPPEGDDDDAGETLVERASPSREPAPEATPAADDDDEGDDDDGAHTEHDLAPSASARRIDVEQAAAASSLDSLRDTLETLAPAPTDAARAASPMVLDAPQRRVSAERNAARATTPWWSWRGWSRRTRVLAVVGGVLLALLVTAWLMLPVIVGWIIRGQLPEAEKALGRKIEFDGVELHGLSGLTLTDVVIYDTDGSAHFVEVGAVTVQLTKSPVFHKDFRVESITVAEPSIALRRSADGTTNYDDFAEKLEKLFEDKKKDPKKPKKPSPIAKYLRPTPRIEVIDGRITLDDALAPTHTIEAIEDLDLVVTQPEIGAPFEIELTTGLDYRLGELGSQSQRVAVRGHYKNKKLGELEVSFPGGLDVPMLDEIAGVEARLGSVTVQLPSTFIVRDLVIGSQRGLEWPLLTAEQVSVELTQLPPKKIGGVFVTETRVQGLYLDLALDEAGRTDVHGIVERALLYFVGPPPSALHKQALAIERQLERGARAGVGKKQRKPDKFDPAAYFFSQRVFVEDATVRIDDGSARGAGALTLDDVDLALGYRPIQKRVELELELAIDGGTGGKLWLGGGYDLSPQTLDARLELQGVELRPLAGHVEQWFAAEYERVFGGPGTGSDGSAAPSVAPASDAGTQLRDALLLTAGRALRLGEVRVSSDLELEADLKGQRFAARGELGVDNLELVEARLSQLPLDDLDLRMELEARADLPARTLELSRLDAELGGARLETRLRLAPKPVEPAPPPPPRKRGSKATELPAPLAEAVAPPMAFDFALRIPEQPAQQVFDGIPHGLRWALDGMELAGTFGFELDAAGSFDALGEMALETRLLGSGFEVRRWPADADVTGLNRGMRMKVRDPRATQAHTILIPPSTHAATPTAASWSTYVPDDGGGHDELYPHWVRYHEMSPWLVQLITTTEDGSFFRHAGFSSMQIASALGENVADGGFVRGASTISMQLVKNVFLGRQKTLARKLQETFLTWLMESVVQVPKARILEVYFNVIEFGPEVYGIGEAARYYFGKRASDLTLREAAFLVSIIPRPRTGESHRLRGAVTERKGERMNWFIDKMYERKCDPEKLARLRRHYEGKGRAMPMEFCCPPPAVIERLKAEPVTFYLPGLDGPDYRPDLYTASGRHLGAPPGLGCDVGEDGLQGGEGEDLLELFEVPDPDAPAPQPAPAPPPGP